MKKADMFPLLAAWFLGWAHLSVSEKPPPAQGPDGKIHFINPSFEDKPGESKTPGGWHSTSLASTPDIFPGAWGLPIAAFDGKTCLGLVTREDGTSEDIAQMLTETLKSGVCYTFSMQLSHADRYVGYNNPARLRIWGAAARGKKEVLLASSVLVDQSAWAEHKFQFVPTKEIRFLIFEAWYAPGVLFRYRGNILLDKCSPIERCDRA